MASFGDALYVCFSGCIRQLGNGASSLVAGSKGKVDAPLRLDNALANDSMLRRDVSAGGTHVCSAAQCTRQSTMDTEVLKVAIVHMSSCHLSLGRLFTNI